jgi:hypothetical protein
MVRQSRIAIEAICATTNSPRESRRGPELVPGREE